MKRYALAFAIAACLTGQAAAETTLEQIDRGNREWEKKHSYLGPMYIARIRDAEKCTLDAVARLLSDLEMTDDKRIGTAAVAECTRQWRLVYLTEYASFPDMIEERRDELIRFRIENRAIEWWLRAADMRMKRIKEQLKLRQRGA